MRILIILLLLTTCKVSTALGVYNGESGKLHRDFQNGEFLNNIGDWLGYLKNRIHERLFGQQTTTTTTTLSPLSTEILNLDKFQFQKRLRNREWFLLDLTNLTFDPNHDWGFRVGSWYFIRKELKNLNGFKNDFEESAVPQSQSTTQSEDSIEINTKNAFETTNDLATTESSTISIPIQSEIPSMTQQISTTMAQNTVQSYSSESSTLTTFKWVGDSKTNEDFTHKGSVEVLMG